MRIIDPSIIAAPDIEFGDWEGFGVRGGEQREFGWRSNRRLEREPLALERYLDRAVRERERAAAIEEKLISRAVREREQVHRSYCFMFMASIQKECRRRGRLIFPMHYIWRSAVEKCRVLDIGESLIMNPSEQSKAHWESERYRRSLYLALSHHSSTSLHKYSLHAMPDGEFVVKRVDTYVPFEHLETQL